MTYIKTREVRWNIPTVLYDQLQKAKAGADKQIPGFKRMSESDFAFYLIEIAIPYFDRVYMPVPLRPESLAAQPIQDVL